MLLTSVAFFFIGGATVIGPLLALLGGGLGVIGRRNGEANATGVVIYALVVTIITAGSISTA